MDTNPAFSDGRFQVLRTLGEGGMGTVYEALDTVRSCPVALKTMRRMEGRSLYRFKHEFRALTDLSHPNLVGLHELFLDGPTPFFTMELIQGETFLSHVRSAALVDCQLPERGVS